MSDGKFNTDNLLFLFKVALGSFTAATTALKVTSFNSAMRGGVSADVFFATILHQIPPLFGCNCNGFPCSPLLRAAFYEIEPACYGDRWLRFAFKYVIIGGASYIAISISKIVIRLNVVMLGANLCNQVFFDSAIAAYPEYSSRLAPWRMVMLFFFVYVGFKCQTDLEKIDAWKRKLAHESEADPEAFRQKKYGKGACRAYPAGLWRPRFTSSLAKLGPLLLAPLLRADKVFRKLKTIGNADAVKETKDREKTLIDAKERMAARLKKQEREAAIMLRAEKRHAEKAEKMVRAQHRGKFCGRLSRRAILFFVSLALVLVASAALQFSVRELSPADGWMALAREQAYGGSELDYASRIALMFIVVDVFLILTGLVGLLGSINEGGFALILFGFIMFVLAVCQGVGIAAVHDTHFLQAARDYARTRMDAMYSDLNCTSSVAPPPPWTPLDANLSVAALEGVLAARAPVRGVFQLHCRGAAASSWVNTLASTDSCNFLDQRHLNASRALLAAATAGGGRADGRDVDFDVARAAVAQLDAQLLTIKGIDACMVRNNLQNVTSGVGTFCVCQSTLGEKLQTHMATAAAFAVCLIVLELWLVHCAIYLLHEKKRRSRLKSLAHAAMLSKRAQDKDFDDPENSRRPSLDSPASKQASLMKLASPLNAVRSLAGTPGKVVRSLKSPGNHSRTIV